MPVVSLLSAGLLGIDAYPIHVEVDVGLGMPRWSTVGLPESAVREAKDRVISAIHNCGYDFPFHRITLNLAPADVKKQGTALDLPIALGLLSAAELVPKTRLKDYLFLGELSLQGGLRPVKGTLAIAILAREQGLKGVVVPIENAFEARPITGVEILGATDLPSVVEFLIEQKKLPLAQELPLPLPSAGNDFGIDFNDVQGQNYAKRALEIAAAGFHHFLLIGPPGTGKSMLASRLPTILPPLNFEESLTTTKIYSLLGMIPPGISRMEYRPFRSPHHTISDAGLIGGGKIPRPGEVSLAHNGVLFLDEFPEFKRNALEALRQPLENHQVTITRSQQSLTYPSRFLLAAAMNACPCGQLGHPTRPCFCQSHLVRRYRERISGPLLDRIDLQIEVPPLALSRFQEGREEESSLQVRGRVAEAHARQIRRLQPLGLQFNSQMGPKEIRKFCRLDSEAEAILEKAEEKWGFSTRVFHRILKVARTIGDLEGKEKIEPSHIGEAIAYRFLDKKAGG